MVKTELLVWQNGIFLYQHKLRVFDAEFWAMALLALGQVLLSLQFIKLSFCLVSYKVLLP